MSRTYRKTHKGKYTTQGKLNALDRKARGVGRYWLWDEWIAHKNSTAYDWLEYSASPSHWNRDVHTAPRRAEERDLMRKIVKGELDPDDVLFPDGKKPFIYWN